MNGRLDSNKVFLKLTQKEMQFLDKEFKKNTRFAWSEKMFANSVRISSDSLCFSRRSKIKSLAFVEHKKMCFEFS